MKTKVLFVLFAASALGSVAAPISRIGAVNWYATIPSSTFVGKCVERSLSPERFRDRTPYYAKLVGTNAVAFSYRTVSDYETEMQYAIDAGIDYFAYCWYEESMPAAAKTGAGDLVGMSHARKLHLQSALKDRLHLCAILTRTGYSDAFLSKLAETMKLPCYEKVRGRPLVYLFTPPWKDNVERLTAACRAVGAPEPYVAIMAKERGDAPSVQAISVYAASTASVKTYEEQFRMAMGDNERRLKSGLEVIPGFSVGWDPSPRVVNPVPWCKYAKGPYPVPTTSAQLLAGARQMRAWVAAHPKECSTGHVMVFAWNEFEEGGWICPTLGADGKPDFARRDAFAAAVREMKGL